MEKIADPRKFKRTKDTLAVFAGRVEGNSACRVRRISGKGPVRLSEGESLLVFTRKLHDNTSWFNGYTYLDTLNPAAVRQFIKVTHDAYKKNIGSRFGKTVPGIFTDEPSHGQICAEEWKKNGSASIPWTDRLPLIFKHRFGYDLVDRLPEIFLDIDGQPFTQARYHYHECVTSLFVDAFSRQIGQWCDRNNILFTGHALAEDTLSHQTIYVGSCMRFYEHMQAPGMDLLTEHRRTFDTAKQVSSAAHQFARKWRLTETYGCTGWDFPFAGHKALGDWQTALGINLRCPHLSWYTMSGEAKRDYPASIFYQSPWWRFYGMVEDYFARINAVMTRGEEVRDLLVVHPVESMWLMFKADWYESADVGAYDRAFWKVSDALLAGHVDFDYGDEEILSRHGRVRRKDGHPVFDVGRASYSTVLVPAMITMRRTTLEILKRFRDAGGMVVFAGDVPGYVDAVASEEIKEFAGTCQRAPATGSGLVEAVENCRRVSIAGPDGKELGPVLSLLREDKDALYLFICNTGQDFASSDREIFGGEIGVRERTLSFPEVTVRGIPGWNYPAVELDPETGQVTSADTRQSAGGYEIRTHLPALGSRLFMIPKTGGTVQAAARPRMKEISRCAVEGRTWDVRLSEPNVLVLDRPRFKIDGGRWQEETEILRVDNAVRDALRIPHRGSAMVQPWARKKNPGAKPAAVSLLYAFECRTVPDGGILLALEEPQSFRISFNGEPVTTDMECGWWTDKSLRTVPLDPARIRPGRNEILLECAYDENHPGLEICYLLGDFGVEVSGTDVSLVAPVASLALGDWGEQGLPFYSGSVRYLKTIRPGIAEGQRLYVRIPDYRGTAVRVLIDGLEAGVRAWEPYEIDVTEQIAGKEEVSLEIEVIGHRRNSHGPFHFSEKWPILTGPGQFVSKGDLWRDGYQLVPCGIMAAPELIVRTNA
jgi:hypothetical protein